MPVTVKMKGSHEAMEKLCSEWDGDLPDVTDENDELIPELVEELTARGIAVEVKVTEDEYEYRSHAFSFD